MDNGSSHRGQACIRRLKAQWPTTIPVHNPIHASWLNQVEVHFSVVQRKALCPYDFSCREDLEDRLLQFQRHYETVASPFRWKFTRPDLDRLLKKLQAREQPLQMAA